MQTHTHHTDSTATPNELQADHDRLITTDEVRRLAGGISDMTLWRWIGQGINRAPLVNERRRYWWRSAVVASLTRAGRGHADQL